ncbi:hypothetical protein BDY24DRAFT_88258 [Mrakia frigida]|uniref:alkene reductase n=1 Tax=Mrakia frigida TaxID=29902 RepID=UPI003FCC02EF
MSPSSSSVAASRLFSPVKLGAHKSIHRVALAPLTRMRTDPSNQVVSELVGTYYEQRASEGGLLISESCFISVESGGWPMVPGIWTPEQTAGWKDTTARVHAKGGLIYCQLAAVGRANVGSQPEVEVVSASAIALKGTDNVPRALTVEEISAYVQAYRQAALNAIEAGFDGVEIHNANGYLLDQFLQSVANKRTDAYGGSIEGRSRFLFEIVQAVTEAIGQDRVGIKFSPWSTFQDMQEKNPIATTFGYVTENLVARFPKLAYLHFLEAAAWGAEGQKTFDADELEDGLTASNDYFRAIVRGIDPSTIPTDDSFVFPDPDEAHPIVFLGASGFNRETAVSHSKRTGDVVVFGRYFISNPDLPQRIKEGVEFSKYDRPTFYTGGSAGYTDYPTATKVQA